MEVHGVTDADARGSEAIYRGDEIVGRVTSGGYGWRVGKSLALAMVRPDLAEIGGEFDISLYWGFVTKRRSSRIRPSIPTMQH